MMADTPESQPPAKSQSRPAKAKYPFWSPRFWHGMTLGTWLRLISSNRFSISPGHWPTALSVTLLATFNSLSALAQRGLYGRAIARTKITEPPIFIIGHWRSGTTMLHELLVLDDRFGFPTTFECFGPDVSLVTAWYVTRLFKFLLPAKRPMDNMAAGWDRPQEDEFALCNMGAGSPYRRIAFPNRPQGAEYLDLVEVAPADLERWKGALTRFLRQITYRSGKPIVLKSPPHTARVATLLEMFPGARFIHIVRDPFVVFSSTIRLWQSLYETQGLQRPRFEGLEEDVLHDFERMYRAFLSQKKQIPPGDLCELRYEDLVRDPRDQMRRIYEQLRLGDFDRVTPKLDEHLAQLKGYQTNRYELPTEKRAEISRRWGDFIRQYGYGS